MLRGKDFCAREAFLCLAMAVAAVLATGCGSNTPPQTSAPPPAAQPAPAGARTYHLEGTVVSVNKEQQSILVNHKDIPGFMGAMTMPYPVAVTDAKMLDQLMPGDQITADVAVDDTGAKLQKIVVVKKGAAKPAAFVQPGAATGDAVPNFSVVNEEGKKIEIERYRGKAVLLTFIYTRCPLPEYCPLVTHNFASIEKNLAQNAALHAKTHLLSISFDPTFDTPAVLRDYASKYGQRRFDHWEFAALPEAETRRVASAFNLFLSEDGGQINHSMSTAIISPEGKLYKLYHDSEWKPAQVLADLTSAAGLRTGNRTETAAVR